MLLQRNMQFDGLLRPAMGYWMRSTSGQTTQQISVPVTTAIMARSKPAKTATLGLPTACRTTNRSTRDTTGIIASRAAALGMTSRRPPSGSVGVIAF